MASIQTTRPRRQTQLTQATPFRRLRRGNPLDRNFPGAGFFIDLGDALAELGAELPDGRRTGERYRYLPHIAHQTVLRPGELTNLRTGHVAFGPGAEVHAVPQPGWHLKAREAGVIRTAPLAEVTALLVRHHIDSGFGTADGSMFASPTGCGFNPGNWIDDFLRPALETLQTTWPEHFPLADTTLKLFRKAGISGWLAYGLDTSVAADWAGHDEATQLSNYKGVIASAGGRRRRWEDIDVYARQSLVDASPRGDGPLATHVRAWLADMGS